MHLGRAIEKFAKNEILGWNPQRKAFELTGVKGSMQVYDRFISDRTFGTKKRLILTPRRDYIPSFYEYVRMGDSLARFMVDALNEDVFDNSPYANTYLVREARYYVQIGRLQGAERASGSGGKKTFVANYMVFGDYERYTANNSKEFDTVDYTVSDVFLPLSTPVTSADLLLIDGKLHEVTEVSRVSNLLWIRAQKIGGDDLVATALSNLYHCDLTARWGQYEVTLSQSGESFSADITHPCHTVMAQVTPATPMGTFTATASFGYGSDWGLHYGTEEGEAILALYDQFKNLLAYSDTGELSWAGEPKAGFILAVTAPNYQVTGTATVTIGMS